MAPGAADRAIFDGLPYDLNVQHAILRVLVQIIGLDVVTQWGVRSGLCSEDGIPNFGRSFALDTKFADLELALSNPMHQLNAADRNSCTSKPL